MSEEKHKSTALWEKSSIFVLLKDTNEREKATTTPS